MALKIVNSGYVSKLLFRGWQNVSDWVTKPASQVIARERLQTQHDQTIDYMNEYLNYYPDTGAADAYIVTIDPAATTYPRMIQFKATNANTGASTINPNGLGAVAIKKNVTSDLVAGDIPSGGVICLVYDDTNYQLVSTLTTPFPTTGMKTDVAQTMTAQLTAKNGTDYTTAQARNVTLSTSAASGGGNGDIWIVYTP